MNKQIIKKTISVILIFIAIDFIFIYIIGFHPVPWPSVSEIILENIIAKPIFHTQKIIRHFRPYNPFEPSREHEKLLGIKIIQLAPKDIQKLHLMIQKEYKKILSPEAKILEIKFSKPRTYRNLTDRIGIVVSDHIEPLDFDEGNGHIFIFKKINNQWEIEKIGDWIIDLAVDEQKFIQNLRKKI